MTESRCLICLDEAALKPVQLQCCPNRIYCWHCIEQWLRININVKSTCPFCRSPVRAHNDASIAFHLGALRLLNVIYMVVLAYTMFGIMSHHICRLGDDDAVTQITSILAVIPMSMLFSLMLLPMYGLMLWLNVVHYDVAWARFWDMCGSAETLLNYDCSRFVKTENATSWLQNSSRHVIYSHIVYNRAWECTTYVVLTLLVVLQCLIIYCLYTLYRQEGKRRFIYNSTEEEEEESRM